MNIPLRLECSSKITLSMLLLLLIKRTLAQSILGRDLLQVLLGRLVVEVLLLELGAKGL